MMLGLMLHPGAPAFALPATGGAPPPPPPGWTTPPAITGMPTVGTVLQGSDGTVGGGTVTARRWRRDGVAIADATGGAYTAVAGDVGAMIDLVVTASGPGGAAQATASAIGPIVARAIETVVIEGDSITSTNPSTPDSAFYSYAYRTSRPDKTIHVRAQASRTARTGGTLDDDSNSLIGNVTEDLAYAPDLIMYKIGANDLPSAETAAQHRASLIAVYQAYAGRTKVAWSPPIPYNPTTDSSIRHPGYDSFTARRADLIATCRDPAVWGQWADYFVPMGLHPAFLAPDAATLYGDGVHVNGPASDPTKGQSKLLEGFRAAMDTLLDATRATATAPYAAVWPASESNLATGAQIVRRFVIAGIAHTGLASGIGVTGGEVRLNGGAYGAAIGRIYNGDVIDLRLTTSAGHNSATAVGLTIGSETRTLTYTTVAQVTPATYAHGDVVGLAGESTVHTFAAMPFAAVGTGILAFRSGGSSTASVAVGGVAATRLFHQDSGGGGWLEVWTVPITATGARDVVITYPGWHALTVLSAGVVVGADPTPTQVDSGAPGSQDTPHPTGMLTVPASGIAVGFFGAYAGNVPPPTTAAGTTFVDEGTLLYQGELNSICVGTRTTAGATSFAFRFGTFARGAVVFKAAGT